MTHDLNTAADVAESTSKAGSISSILMSASSTLLEAFGGVPTDAARLVLAAELGLRICGVSSPEAAGTMPIIIDTGHEGDHFAGILASSSEPAGATVVQGRGRAPAVPENGVSLDDRASLAAFVASADMITATQIAVADVVIGYIVRHLADEKAKKKGRWVDQASKHELADIVIQRDIAEAHLAHAREVGLDTVGGRRYLILSLLAAGECATAAVAAGRRTALERADAEFLAGASAAHVSLESLMDAAGRPVSLRTALYRATKGH